MLNFWKNRTPLEKILLIIVIIELFFALYFANTPEKVVVTNCPAGERGEESDYGMDQKF